MTVGPENDPAALPAGTRLEPAADLQTRLGGRILIGGSPLTITRLSPAGADLTRHWFAGAPVGDDPKHHALARRLIATGMAHCRLEAEDREPGRDRLPPASVSITVVIPVKDDDEGLRATLHGLIDSPTGPAPSAETVAKPEVIIVDDGSLRPVEVPETGDGTGGRTSVVRRAEAGGPGLARQAGLAEVTTPVVAFVDAGVLVTTDQLQRLAATLCDPAVVAVAPRIRSIGGHQPVARYDAARSPLDLGPGQSLVGPGRQIPYVPTACLVARTESVARVGGFDPGLRYGEDVDLVWRLAGIGAVRYRPQIEVRHPPRKSLPAMVRQRHGYGSAAAPLATRHGPAVAPARLSPWSLLVAGLAVAGRPLLTAAAVVGTGLALRPKIRPLPDLTADALLLTARGHWYGGLSLLTAAVRAWAPFLALFWLLVPSQRRRIAVLLGAAFGRRLIDGPREPGAAVIDVGIGVIDDLAYCSGVWAGAFAERSPQALAIDMTSWPKPKR